MPEVLRAYNGMVDSKFNGNSLLKVLELREEGGEKRLVGSNSFVHPILYRVLPEFRAAKPEEVEMTLADGDSLGIKGRHYVNSGAVLDFSGNNHELAVRFFEQLPKELRDIDRLPAVMIGYDLINCKVGDYGVAPKYVKGTELRTAKMLLNPSGRFNAKDEELVRSGLPSKLRIGKRTLNTPYRMLPFMENLGISGFDVSWYLDVGADYWDLAYSNDIGWVASVSRKAARAKN